MKNHIKSLSITLIVFSVFSQPVLADRHGSRHGGDGYRGGGYRGGYGHPGFGFYFGAPLFPSPFYSYPYQQPYYPPAVITVPARPPVYIQQPPPVTEQYPAGYWYYCYNPEGYYPYIRECPSGWQQVEPTPPEPR